MQAATKEWLTVAEFLERHRGQIGRNTVYDRIRDKTIPAIKLGKRILIRADVLDRIAEAAERAS